MADAVAGVFHITLYAHKSLPLSLSLDSGLWTRAPFVHALDSSQFTKYGTNMGANSNPLVINGGANSSAQGSRWGITSRVSSYGKAGGIVRGEE
jgi:hypothetical protein